MLELVLLKSKEEDISNHLGVFSLTNSTTHRSLWKEKLNLLTEIVCNHLDYTF